VETAGFRCEQTTSVVLVPLAGLGQKLEVMARLAGAGISVQHFYMLTNPDGSSHLVLKTRDDDRAISAIASQPAGSRAIERMFFTTPPAPTGAGDGLRTTEERLRSGTALAANLQPLRKENNHEPVEMGSVRVAALGPVQGN
jgi:hypothetical protein